MLQPVRRIVTLRDRHGVSHCVSDGEPPSRVPMPGAPIEIIDLWATARSVSLPIEDDPTSSAISLLPAPGETRFRLVRIDPTPGADPAQSMHRNDSVEYLVVLRGQTHLVLADGTDLFLKPGDCVVQNGTEHAWQNDGPEPCWVAVILIGSEASRMAPE